MKRLLCSLLLSAACNGASPSGSPTVPASSGEPDAPSAHAEEKPRPVGDPQPTLPIGIVEFEAPAPRAPLTLRVEVASTDEQRQMGMMFREQLGDDEGMLFIFPTERRNSFWMRNTFVPLDMLFLDSEWTVVGIVESAEPLTDTPRGVPRMSQYVLEVNAGFAKRHGYTAGQKVRFIPPSETQ